MSINKNTQTISLQAVVLLDADFVIGPPSWGRALVHNQTTYDTLLKLLQRKAALVLPALRDIDNPEYVPTEDSKAFISDVVQRMGCPVWCAYSMDTCVHASGTYAQGTANNLWCNSCVIKSFFLL